MAEGRPLGRLRRHRWLALALAPAAIFSVLFLIPIGTWNPGEPGLASGRLDVEIDAGRTAGASWLQAPGEAPRPATVRFAWREGARLHVELRSGEAAVTLVLTRSLLGATRASAVLRTAGSGVAERRALTGTLTLVAQDWGTTREPAGTFVLAVGERRWAGAFAP